MTSAEGLISVVVVARGFQESQALLNFWRSLKLLEHV